MADTRRALATLQNLLADNTTGDISAQDVRDLLLSVYGEGVLLESQDASSSSTLDFTSWYSSLYSIYKIKFDLVLPSSNGANLEFLVGGGGSFDTSNIYSGGMHGINAAAGWTNRNYGANQATGTVVVQVSSTSTYGVNGELWLHGAGSSAAHKSLFGKITAYDSTGGVWIMNEVVDIVARTTAIDRIRFKFSTGNLASGSISIYGVPKA